MSELKEDQQTLGGQSGSIREEGNRRFIFAYCAAAETVGQVRVISHTGVVTTNPSAIAPATLAVYQYVGVATKTTTAAGWQWYQIKGDVNALVEGTTDVAVGDYLEVLNTELSFKKDATARSTNSVAIAQAAQATNSAVLTPVYLLGDRVIVAAS